MGVGVQGPLKIGYNASQSQVHTYVYRYKKRVLFHIFDYIVRYTQSKLVRCYQEQVPSTPSCGKARQHTYTDRL
jgi:hypothetical protein